MFPVIHAHPIKDVYRHNALIFRLESPFISICNWLNESHETVFFLQKMPGMHRTLASSFNCSTKVQIIILVFFSWVDYLEKYIKTLSFWVIKLTPHCYQLTIRRTLHLTEESMLVVVKRDRLSNLFALLQAVEI